MSRRRIFRMLQPLKLRPVVQRPTRFSSMGGFELGRNSQRGKRVERPVATGRGKPLKAETQGCYRHEIGSERCEAE